jgi:anti-sigma factor RsiW
MNITPDVVNDLLPLYLAGEASPGTRALIEEYLRDHPAFAAEVRAQAEQSQALLSRATVSIAAPPDHEKATLERVRRFNRYRTYVLALALACTMMPLSFAFVGDQIRWTMLGDNPRLAVFLWVAALGCWVAHYRLGRRLRTEAG